jgi:hypothetical protein
MDEMSSPFAIYRSPRDCNERIHEVRKLGTELELKPILDEVTPQPILDLEYGDDILCKCFPC